MTQHRATKVAVGATVLIVAAAVATLLLHHNSGGARHDRSALRHITGRGYTVGVPPTWRSTTPPQGSQAVVLALGPPGPQGQRQGLELRRASNTTSPFDKDVQLFNILQQNLHPGRRVIRQVKASVAGAEQATEIEASYRDNGLDVVQLDLIARKRHTSYHLVALGAPSTMTKQFVSAVSGQFSVSLRSPLSGSALPG